MNLTEQLHSEMIAAYEVTGREIGYWGHYFLRSVKRHGGLATAKRMLQKKPSNPSEQKGFRALVEAGRPDLSLESLVLAPRFRSLFTPEELAEAQRRLDSVPKYARRRKVGPGENHPEDIREEREYTEGSKKTVTINAYERDPKARSACLARHGYSCRVCELTLEDIYGDIGRKFIHVHHKKPLAGRRSDYKIKPTTDLAPVCPNCHAMLHTSDPPLGIEELKGRMANPYKASGGQEKK